LLCWIFFIRIQYFPDIQSGKKPAESETQWSDPAWVFLPQKTTPRQQILRKEKTEASLNQD